LLRDAADGWELLLIERHAATTFAGGAMVFPGGRVDPGDATVAADAGLADGFASLDSIDAAARVAAAREAFEEADVLLTTGPTPDPALCANWRARLNAGTADWSDFLRAGGIRLDAAMFVPFANWVPPAAAPIARRFDTLFYLAHMPPGMTATADGHEAVDLHWTTPAAAIRRADVGEIGLLFPTRRNLERLAQYASIDALLAATRTRPVVRIQPEIVSRDGGQWLTIPSGADYPVTEEALTATRRE
jgi:8-oxo-dGTP pyrophosphatase MutT (NUDIX family)